LTPRGWSDPRCSGRDIVARGNRSHPRTKQYLGINHRATRGITPPAIINAIAPRLFSKRLRNSGATEYFRAMLEATLIASGQIMSCRWNLKSLRAWAELKLPRLNSEI
jgi:hypothetical protein